MYIKIGLKLYCYLLKLGAQHQLQVFTIQQQSLFSATGRNPAMAQNQQHEFVMIPRTGKYSF